MQDFQSLPEAASITGKCLIRACTTLNKPMYHPHRCTPFFCTFCESSEMHPTRLWLLQTFLTVFLLKQTVIRGKHCNYLLVREGYSVSPISPNLEGILIHHLGMSRAGLQILRRWYPRVRGAAPEPGGERWVIERHTPASLSCPPELG